MATVLWFLAALFAPAVAGLGHDDFGTRERAEAVLRWSFPLSEPAVRRAVGGADPEVAHRCRRVYVAGWNRLVGPAYWAPPRDRLAFCLIAGDFGDGHLGLPWLPWELHERFGGDVELRRALAREAVRLELVDEPGRLAFNPDGPWQADGTCLPGLDNLRFAYRRLPDPQKEISGKTLPEIAAVWARRQVKR